MSVPANTELLSSTYLWGTAVFIFPVVSTSGRHTVELVLKVFGNKVKSLYIFLKNYPVPNQQK